MDTSLKQQALELYQPPKCSEDGTLIEGDSLESTIIDLMMVAVIKGKKKYVNKYIDLLGPAKIEQILRIFACEDGRDFQAGNYQLNSMIRELHAHNERAALGYKRIFNPEYFAKKDNIFITELGRRMDREADPKGFKKSIESVYQELDFYVDKSYIPKNSNFDKLAESLPVTALEDYVSTNYKKLALNPEIGYEFHEHLFKLRSPKTMLLSFSILMRIKASEDDLQVKQKQIKFAEDLVEAEALMKKSRKSFLSGFKESIKTRFKKKYQLELEEDERQKKKRIILKKASKQPTYAALVQTLDKSFCDKDVHFC